MPYFGNKSQTVVPNTSMELCPSDRLVTQLENWYDEFSEKHPEIVESFTRYLKNKENDSVVNDVKKLLLMEFYNKRNIILENRKKQGLNSMLDE